MAAMVDGRLVAGGVCFASVCTAEPGSTASTAPGAGVVLRAVGIVKAYFIRPSQLRNPVSPTGPNTADPPVRLGPCWTSVTQPFGCSCRGHIGSGC